MNPFRARHIHNFGMQEERQRHEDDEAEAGGGGGQCRLRTDAAPSTGAG